LLFERNEQTQLVDLVKGERSNYLLTWLAAFRSSMF